MSGLDQAYLDSELKRAKLLTEIKAIAETIRHPNTKSDDDTCQWAAKALLALIQKYQ